MNSDSNDDKTVIYPLTNLETKILILLAKKYSNKQIVDELGFTEHTLKSHCRSIFEKLGARNTWEAIKIAQDRKIV